MLRNGILVVILRPSMRVEDRYVFFIEIYDRMLNRISDTYSRYRVTSFCFTVKGLFEQNYLTKMINIVHTVIDVRRMSFCPYSTSKSIKSTITCTL